MVIIIFSKYVEVKWNSKNKSYFIDKGYAFTKMGDILTIQVEDLKPNSFVEVEFTCDYCGDTYLKKWVYHQRNITRSTTINKDACDTCVGEKTKESNIVNYGVSSIRHVPEINEKVLSYLKENNDEIQKKSKQKVLEIYGVENVFQNEEIKDNIKNNNLINYGVEYTSQRQDVIDKVQATKVRRYGKGINNILFVNRRKENHHNWQGGISSENHLLRTSNDNYKWRKSVLLRDSHTCQCCGSTNKICAHHIFNWKSYPDLRFEVDNGIVLCEQCHREFHCTYSYPNNKEQINSFINDKMKTYAELTRK